MEQMDMKNIKIKNCPYCKSKLRLQWYQDPDDEDEKGYICYYCGMFLDVELQGEE